MTAFERKRPPGGGRMGVNFTWEQPVAVTTSRFTLYGKNRPGASAANEEAHNAPLQSTPLRNVNDNTAHKFAQASPVLARHAGDPEPLVWERYKVAFYEHALERCARSQRAWQRAHKEWATVFVGGDAA